MSGERFMGIDLTASSQRPSSVCLLTKGFRLTFHEARLDDEVVELAVKYSPACVAVDAPLSYPSGVAGPGVRLCEREARGMGIRLFPVSFGAMRLLTERGMGIASRLRALGFEVIETFPSGAQRMLGVWRGGRRSAASLAERLRKRLGLRLPEKPTLDMVDAATCAYVALLYVRGMCVVLGDRSEGLLYLPAKSTRLSAPRHSSYRSMRSSRRSRSS
ncbi:MAG: DUF429 domain-containing protein [Nitrososphaerota archaeon]